MLANAEIEIPDTVQELAREYLNFLDDDDDGGANLKKMKEMLTHCGCRMIVNINDLMLKLPVRGRELMKNASLEHIALQNALKELVFSSDSTPKLYTEYYIGFEGNFGNRHVSPRTLSSRFLNNLVCLEGIVTQCSLVRPKVVRSVHYCPATNKLSDRRYTDFTNYNPLPTSTVYPTKDLDGNLLETEYGLSTYKDHQTLIIQEMPEKAPAGQLPRAVDVVCDNDLADKCKPGDRVQIVGIYKCLPAKKNGYTTGVFKTVVLACNITHLSKEAKIHMTREDIANCRKIAKKRNSFDLVSRSLAPSIHGHEYVKKAILCMLLGGVEKKLPNGTRLRGDINILLIGDPSVAKSQILRYVLGTAPRAIATTGRGSSGVGLTAAVTSDSETGEKRLEAGAMVLADRGVVCIDEFDKMSDIDRTAIHEVMEQGRVTIAKAGIHARLNARCSVLAAANPVYGRYDQYKPPMENIGLQDSLLSRFDLLFVMLDSVNSEVDGKIAEHVVRMHRYRNPLEQDGQVLPLGTNVDFLTNQDKQKGTTEKKTAPMYEKYDPLWHGESRKKTDRIFSVQFMRIYLHIAKTIKPYLTDEANAIIAEEYSRIRSQDAVEAGVARTQPVTVRTLETMIRLASAHAKARLSCRVEEEDALAAIELVQYAYFKKVLEKERKRRREAVTSDEEDEILSPTVRTNSAKRKALDTSVADSVLPGNDTTTQHVDEETIVHGDVTMDVTDTTPDSITDERFLRFRKKAADVFRTANIQTIEVVEFEKVMNADMETPFSKGEINVALQKMTDENQIMESEGVLYLI